MGVTSVVGITHKPSRDVVEVQNSASAFPEIYIQLHLINDESSAERASKIFIRGNYRPAHHMLLYAVCGPGQQHPRIRIIGCGAFDEY